MYLCSISRKQPYPTAAAAWRVVLLHAQKRWLRTHKENRRPGNAYRCVHCQQWHITQHLFEAQPYRVRVRLAAREART